MGPPPTAVGVGSAAGVNRPGEVGGNGERGGHRPRASHSSPFSASRRHGEGGFVHRARLGPLGISRPGRSPPYPAGTRSRVPGGRELNHQQSDAVGSAPPIEATGDKDGSGQSAPNRRRCSGQTGRLTSPRVLSRPILAWSHALVTCPFEMGGYPRGERGRIGSYAPELSERLALLRGSISCAKRGGIGGRAPCRRDRWLI